MPNLKLGVTATELFTYNPYRILGTAVDTPAEKITELYNKLLEMAESGTISQYKTDYDFPGSLPPFERDVSALKTAYAKIASNGYRCFAYSNDQFSTALNVDDIMLNLRDITCYDCFLRCYMWLITNDREFEEHELWILLCKHIDSMIMSTPDDWAKLFDHRFPENLMGDRISTFRTLYATFCDIILLPIKEMVRGSMRCSTATEILKVAGVDVEEQFEYVDIPQANIPKPGEPAPLLKIAVKDGEEYFDVNRGQMVSFKSDSETKVESNSFDTSTRTISAAAIIGDRAPMDKDDYIPPEPEFTKAAPPEADKLEKIKPIAPRPKPGAVRPAANVKPAASVKPVDQDAPKAPAQKIPAQAAPVMKTPQQINEETVAQTDEDGDVVIPTRRHKVKIPQKGAEAAAHASLTEADDTPVLKYTPKVGKPLPTGDGAPKTATPFKKNQKSLADFVDEVEEETTEEEEDEEEEEENIYTNVLIKMLRSNRTETMKGVDTKHVFDNGDSLGQAAEPGLEMDAINEKRMDKSLLASNLDQDLDTDDPKKLMAEKYKGINIDDMLNPISPNKFAQQFKQNAIHEYTSNKERKKKTNIAIIKFCLLLFFVILLIFLLYIAGVL